MNHNPQCPVSRTFSTDKTKYSHSESWIHYPAQGDSFAKSPRASSSLINDILLPASGEAARCKLDHLRSELEDRLAAAVSSHPELHFPKALLLSEMQFSVWFGGTSCLAFGLGHTLRHRFYRNSFAGHFDVNEECGRGQAGAICLQ